MFFGLMSNSPRASPLRLPIFSAGAMAFFGQDCLLCTGASERSIVCAACEHALARPSAGCAICAVALPQPGLCGECQRRAPAYDAALAAFDYRFPLDRLVQRFKFSGDLAVGRWLARRLLERVRAEPRPDLIVVPPLARGRLRKRGFNQALVVGNVIGRALGVRCARGALTKLRDTAPQPGLGWRERRANLRNAFRCDAAFSGERIALVDDVMTTGATADTLARLLKRAGAGRVDVWAVARTPDPAGR